MIFSQSSCWCSHCERGLWRGWGGDFRARWGFYWWWSKLGHSLWRLLGWEWCHVSFIVTSEFLKLFCCRIQMPRSAAPTALCKTFNALWVLVMTNISQQNKHLKKSQFRTNTSDLMKYNESLEYKNFNFEPKVRRLTIMARISNIKPWHSKTNVNF